MSHCTSHPVRPVLRRASNPFASFILVVCTFGMALPLVWVWSPGHVRRVNRRRMAAYRAQLDAHTCTRRRARAGAR